MRKNNSNSTIAVIGAIVGLFSLIAFFLLNKEKTALHWWALVFLIVAEIVFFSGLSGMKTLEANRNKVFMKLGVTAILSLYLIITFITFLCVDSFWDHLNGFIVLELAIMMISAVIIIAINNFAQKISDSGRKTAISRIFMDVCERKVYNLFVDSKNQAYKKNLNEIYEIIKYSDKIGLSSIDGQIEAKITELENALNSGDQNKDDITGIFNDITTYMNQRKEEIKESKRGGF